ncbi:hypothetical protein, partial [Kitasatospora sp. NPDC056531]|uniref:hypothetical protein n=1 Tax=Kitasatospora sp. NPDC056531 TaxID=3345856 RepID=UPI0036C28BF6
MAIVEQAEPDYRCVMVTNSFHTVRAALIARHDLFGWAPVVAAVAATVGARLFSGGFAGRSGR